MPSSRTPADTPGPAIHPTPRQESAGKIESTFFHAIDISGRVVSFPLEQVAVVRADSKGQAAVSLKFGLRVIINNPERLVEALERYYATSLADVTEEEEEEDPDDN